MLPISWPRWNVASRVAVESANNKLRGVLYDFCPICVSVLLTRPLVKRVDSKLFDVTLIIIVASSNCGLSPLSVTLKLNW